jgi:2-enoate reductase
VKKVLNTEVSPQLIMEERPDAVVVATGGIPLIPDIPGIDDDSVVSFEDVLLGKASAGDRVVIIGGGLIGCDTALFLAEQGKSVTIVRRGEKIGRELSPSFIHRVYSKFKQLDVKMLTGVTYEEINERGLVITRDDAERLLEADMVVIAAGYLPDDSLYNELQGKVPQLYLVGDSREPRSIVEAVHEAFASALAV